MGKQGWIGLVGALALAGCGGPLVVYDKPGVSVERLATDLQICADQALARAPVNITRERVTVRVREYRYGVPRIGYDRAWVDIDRNEVVRSELRLQCLAEKGYRPAQLPRCPSGTEAGISRDTRQVAAGPQSCAVSVSGVPVILPGG